jgi:hypothetical protein
VCFIAAIPAYGEQRRSWQSRGIRKPIHAAGKGADAVPFFLRRDEANLMRRPKQFLVGAVLGVGVDDSAHCELILYFPFLNSQAG